MNKRNHKNTYIYLFLLLQFFCNNLLSQKCNDADKLIQQLETLPTIDENQFIERLEETLKDCLKGNKSYPRNLGDIYHKLGVLYFNKESVDQASDYKKAIEYIQLAIEMKEKNPNIFSKEEIGHSYLNLGNFQNYLENYAPAIVALEKAIPYFKASNSPKLYQAYYFLGDLYKNVEDYQQSITYLQNLENHFENDNNLLIPIKFTRAYSNKELGLYKKAEKEYNSLLKYIEEIGTSNYYGIYASTLSQLADNFFKQNNYVEALNLNNKSAEYFLRDKNVDTENLIHVYSSKVEILAATGKFKDAEQLVTKTIEMALRYFQSPHQPIIGRLYHQKGEVLTLQNREGEALEIFQNAIQSLDPSFNKNSAYENPIILNKSFGDKKELRTTLYLKAKNHFQQYEKSNQQKDLIAAFNTYETLDTLITKTRQLFLSARSKYLLQQKIIPIYEDAITISLKLYQLTKYENYKVTAYDFMARNKAIILIEGLQDEREKLKNIPSELFDKEERLKKMAYDLEVEIYEAEQKKETIIVKKLQGQLFTTKRNYEKLINTFEEDYPDYYRTKYNYYSKLNVTEIQSNLDIDRVVVEFFVGEKTLFVSVISNNNFEIFSSKLTKEFFNNCKEFIEITKGKLSIENQESKFSQVSYNLYKKLFQEAFQVVDKSVNRLTIIPDNILLHIPYDALLTQPFSIQKWYDKKIPFLLKKYATSQVFARSLLFDKEGKRKIEVAQKEFVGFGIEYYDYTNQRTENNIDLELQKRTTKGILKHADDEVEEIRELIGGDIFTNENATKKAFMEIVSNYRIVHFASHAFGDEKNALSSSLIFAKTEESLDYQLKVADIYTMNINADLVVLSACQTNYGGIQYGEGMRTLSRAFAYAGTPSLIASSGEIPDKSSKDITVEFYRASLQHGYTKDVALQKAKLKYLENADGNTALPHLWAHLNVIGDLSELETGFNEGSSWWFYLVAGLFFVFLLRMFKTK